MLTMLDTTLTSIICARIGYVVIAFVFLRMRQMMIDNGVSSLRLVHILSNFRPHNSTDYSATYSGNASTRTLADSVTEETPSNTTDNCSTIWICKTTRDCKGKGNSEKYFTHRHIPVLSVGNPSSFSDLHQTKQTASECHLSDQQRGQ